MTTIDQQMKDALNRIETALPQMTWLKKPLDYDGSAYEGYGDGIHLCVVEFSLEPQGFPKGSKGYDGAATIGRNEGPLIIHLTRELAEKAYRIAKQ